MAHLMAHHLALMHGSKVVSMLGCIDPEGEPDSLLLGTEDNNGMVDGSSVGMKGGSPDGLLLG